MKLPDWWGSDKPYKIMDCLEGMKDMPDQSIDLIIADPPYYRIMLHDHANNKYDWDNQWASFDNFLTWCGSWMSECHRILKHNGSIYVFADDKNSSHVHIELEKLGFFLENHIVWVKPNNMTIKGWRNYNCYAPITERLLFCSKEQRTHNLENEFYNQTIRAFSPIIEYMIGEKRKIKELMRFETDKEFDEYVNKVTDTKSVVSRHYFTYSQWCFPTEELYKKLQGINDEVFRREYEVFRREYEDLRREYEDLRREYEDLRREYEDLLRPFIPSENYTDVWTENITSSNEETFHPTQKSVKIFKRIIATSSRYDAIVLDPFLGSGTTLRACRETDRIGLGFEINPDYESIIKKRIMENVPNIETFGEQILE